MLRRFLILTGDDSASSVRFLVVAWLSPRESINAITLVKIALTLQVKRLDITVPVTVGRSKVKYYNWVVFVDERE